MIMTWQEYAEEEVKFSNLYFHEIRKLLKEEQSKYVKEYRKEYTFKIFFKEYCVIAVFFFIIAFILNGYGIISFDTLSVCTFLAFVAYTFVYDRWQADIKKAALISFSNKSKSIVADFVYNKMREDVSNAVVGVDFERKVQFYSVAIHEVPEKYCVGSYELDY